MTQIEDKLGNPTLEKYALLKDLVNGKIKSEEVGRKLIEIDNRYTPLYARALEKIGILLGLRPAAPYNSTNF